MALLMAFLLIPIIIFSARLVINSRRLLFSLPVPLSPFFTFWSLVLLFLLNLFISHTV